MNALRPPHTPAFRMHESGATSQAGMALIEAMVAILVFAVGVLAMIGMQTLAVKTASDAKYRADAAYLANQLIGQMWTADKNTANANNITTFRHNCTNTTSGCATTCTVGNSASTNPVVVDWLAQLVPTAPASPLLPGASSGLVTISVVPVQPVYGNSLQTNFTYLVAISICWQLPEDKAAATPRFHQYVTAAQIS
ncbi:MAG: type IV pilus modification protein PilV [Rhodocyclaceae bacterium]|nr:type IV pilus modification protein PilV [Rhodocyclaceae bacterium]